MVEIDAITLATIAFFQGIGITFGTELAKTLFSKVNGYIERRGNKKDVKCKTV